MSAVQKAIEADRRLRPELYRKADSIAEIIDPSAFAAGYDSTAPDADPLTPTKRQQYYAAVARRKAWEILQYLGIAPEETDWVAIFDEMASGEAP